MFALMPIFFSSAGYAVGAPNGSEPERVLISKIGSERATTGGGNKLVTREGKTHIAWQDSTDKGYFNRVRTYVHETGQLTDTVTLNQGEDNHARPTLIIDHAGYLHAIISGHNSPVTHMRSKRPNDASAWTEPVTIGSGTYPVSACGPEGTLYVLLRSANRWNGVDLYVKPPDGSWQMRQKLVHRDEQLTGYAAFHSGLTVAPDGTLHVLIDFYESKGVWDQRGLHQAVAYMKSRDRGKTWTRADGTPIDLPGRPKQMDPLAQDRAESRHEAKPPPVITAQGAMVLDGGGRPHVLYVDHRKAPGRLVHATANADGQWSREPVEAIESKFPDHRPTRLSAALTIREDGVMFALLELRSLGKGWHEGLPTRSLRMGEAGDERLAWIVSRDGGETWSARPAMAGHSANEPNLERPAGGNRIDAEGAPPFVFFEGPVRYPEKGETIQNEVYLVLPR